MDALFKTICGDFSLKGRYIGYDVIKAGNINDTYVITTENGNEIKQYLVQKVNEKVFHDPFEIAANMQLVTSHIEKKLREEGYSPKEIRRRVIRLYKNKENKYFYVSPDKGYWRVMSYIYDSVGMDSLGGDVLTAAGEAFGTFQRHLNDFPAHLLHETIPGFHDTEKRFKTLFAVAEENKFDRLKDVSAEFEYLKNKMSFAEYFNTMYKQGKIPLRVTHNDTKCNNVLFDRKTGEPLAVIDLDTVMAGFAAHDFGDAVRFAANDADEDEEDLSKVSLNLDKYEKFAAGFIPQIESYAAKTELESLPLGVFVMTLELAARFMTDYLQGDVYFKVKKDRHNYYRTRCQTALAMDIEKKLPEMKNRIFKYQTAGITENGF